MTADIGHLSPHRPSGGLTRGMVKGVGENLYGSCEIAAFRTAVPMRAQTAAKGRGSSPPVLECSTETDSTLEGDGLEPPVPPARLGLTFGPGTGEGGQSG